MKSPHREEERRTEMGNDFLMNALLPIAINMCVMIVVCLVINAIQNGKSTHREETNEIKIEYCAVIDKEFVDIEVLFDEINERVEEQLECKIIKSELNHADISYSK